MKTITEFLQKNHVQINKVTYKELFAMYDIIFSGWQQRKINSIDEEFYAWHDNNLNKILQTTPVIYFFILCVMIKADNMPESDIQYLGTNAYTKLGGKYNPYDYPGFEDEYKDKTILEYLLLWVNNIPNFINLIFSKVEDSHIEIKSESEMMQFISTITGFSINN